MTNELSGLHAVAYARVSTDDKGQDTGVQIDAINKWADANGVIIDRAVCEDVSGAVWPRQGLSDAIVTLVTSGASMLVCYDQSRLTRNAPEHLPLIKQLLGSKVIRYVVNGDADPDSIGVRLVNSIKAETDKEERHVLSEKTKLGLYHRRDVLNKHIGRPARVIIADDTDGFKTGLITDKTILLKPSKVLAFASQGWTPCYVAQKLLDIPPCTFIRELRRSGVYDDYYKILNGGIE